MKADRRSRQKSLEKRRTKCPPRNRGVTPAQKGFTMKEAIFVGSSLRDLRKFPEEARSEAGHAIYLAQKGERAINALPLTGFGGASVFGNRHPRRRRCIPRGLYREVRYGDLCASRFSEEVQEGSEDALAGHEHGPLEAEG